ncbi:Planctomycete cytochrome C [Rubripirellula lacrimiformis]|uniref:Planctomycete cytochrome C n=1 Tax=Rubripirellula lacrimiformis TaxID=1930273 RepID=A0A517N6U6_9BACT|nr:PSD1 and planctomycete cytochrome C domain-containing protein [Rubripirellula lacrimiformis]QDT02852.1 Planctomycete cytochrome C [Rubripirellula lacrimiformis]
MIKSRKFATRRRARSIIGAVCVAVGLGGVAMTSMAETPAKSEPKLHADADKHFTLKVLPLLKEKCFGCHGSDPDDLKGDYDVRTREATMVGGESGEVAVVEGDPENSILYQAVMWDSLEMPPKENDRLTDDQTEMVRRWIMDGAPWPDAETQDSIMLEERKVAVNDDGVLISTSGGLADQWTYRRYEPEDIWGFQPVRTQFDQDTIDGFVDQQLQAAQIRAAGQAEPRLLVRRAYLDLLGLPPSPDQTEQFLTAWEQDSDQAWANLIDQLLDSPHYGERWAQHWLDVVRYADTGGFSNDYERSNAWRYRDYVIRSFNADKPYNEFVLEQIAGDELRPDDPEARIATGFLRMGPWGTAMIPQDEARQLFRDDVVHSIGQSFLSMPMRCCKCHDHKFDPIPTQDYYRMYAAISASQPAEIEAEFLPSENQVGFDEGKTLVTRLHEFADGERQALIDKQEAAAKKWYDEKGLPYKDEKARKDDPDDQKPPRYAGLDESEKGRLKVRQQDAWIWKRRFERFDPMTQSVFNGPDYWLDAKKLRQPKKVDPKWRPESFIHTGGSLSAKGAAVTPGVLSGCGVPVEGAPIDDPFALTTDVEGRRLGLAKWIVDPRNPLTARSFVNRLWQYHFGRGLVGTPNNFGVKGSKPTHPELLDWLTGQFVDGGWKSKPIHRMIMMSDAYKRSTWHPDLEGLELKDPANDLLARFTPRRMTAEEMRDSMLSASGELNPEMGGLPIMPEINLEVALQPRMIQFSIAPAYQPSQTPQQRNRRTIYAYRVRGQADPFLEVLNQPNPNESCDLRDAAAVSPQAFTLMNSELMTDRAIGLAKRLMKDANDLPGRIELAFQLTMGREPTANEQTNLQSYVRDMVTYHQNHEPGDVSYPTKVVRSLVEEFSGEPFEIDELLPNFENYSPDSKPATVSEETRALADACLLLFNANEFVYIY